MQRWYAAGLLRTVRLRRANGGTKITEALFYLAG
jgi:hypothetical protein